MLIVLKINVYLYFLSSRASAVGIATGYGLDGRGVGVRVPDRVKNFLFSTSSRPPLEAHPASYPMGTGTLLHGDKAAGA
jgi:hypothetical protein